MLRHLINRTSSELHSQMPWPRRENAVPSRKTEFEPLPDQLTDVTYDNTAKTQTGQVSVSFAPSNDDNLADMGIASVGLILATDIFKNIEEVSVTLNYQEYNCDVKKYVEKTTTNDPATGQAMTFTSDKGFAKYTDGRPCMSKCLGPFKRPTTQVTMTADFKVKKEKSGSWENVSSHCGIKTTLDTKPLKSPFKLLKVA